MAIKPFEQPPHHEKAQQRQPDQVVKIFQSRANHSTIEEINKGIRSARAAAVGGIVSQLPEHQACSHEEPTCSNGSAHIPNRPPMGHQSR